MIIQKKIKIELQRKALLRPVDLVQYDTGIQLLFTVMDFDIPAGTTATLYVQKPSGKFVYQESGVTVSGNTVTIDLENQSLAEYGEAGYQVQLKNGEDQISTFAGILRVEKSLADANAEESKTVISGFDAAITKRVAAAVEAYLKENPVTGVTDEQIAQAVSDYLTENPVQAGATAEQAAQIQANAEAIEQLQQTGGSGVAGENGATFTPALAEDGTLSWTNDKGLDNPDPVNIMGPQGEPGAAGYTPVRGTDYWTDADKAEIKAYVDDAILGGTW